MKPTINRIAGLALAVLALTGAWAVATPDTAAAQGELAYDGCLANDALQDCDDLPGAPLHGPRAVATSPDGQSIYVASTHSDSIAHFERSGPDGQIGYRGCLANDASQACVDLPGTPLTNASGIAVSPDGKSVYVVSLASGGSITHFFRGGSDGEIAFDGCLSSDAGGGCGELPGRPLDGATGVAVSPDGKSVYVASRLSNAVAHFFRNGPDGQIAYDGCLSNQAGNACGDVPGAPLHEARAVAVSPDGRSVYVASSVSNSVAHFFRNGPDGQIAYDGCLANDASQGCGDLPGAPLDASFGVAVSPDGKSVYVTSFYSDSIAHFFRNGPDGQIAYDGCLANTGADGCIDLPAAPLNAASGVAVSPDGKSVYVASVGSDSVAHFVRGGPDGHIAYDGCLANTDVDGCVDLPQLPLADANAVAVSPDGKSVYATGGVSDSIAHFFRAPPLPDPTPSPDPTPTPQPTPDPPRTRDTGPPQTRIGKGPARRTKRTIARLRFSSSEAGSRFECKLDGRKWRACTSPHELKRVRAGRHRFAVRAIDPSGNVDPTPANRRWKVAIARGTNAHAPTPKT